MRIIVLSSAVVLLSFLALQALAEEKGAKGIFYSGEGPTVMAKPPSAHKGKTESTIPHVEKYMGISYWIELVDRGGEMKRVATTRTFRNGERIKLHIETNRDGYLYVINIGSTGQSRILFPHPCMAGNNFIRAWTHYDVPYNTYMRFDENPGEELLLVILSPKSLGDIPFTPPLDRPLNTGETNYYIQTAQAKGAKDIVLETESSGPQLATYIVAPMSSLETNMITRQIKLKHN